MATQAVQQVQPPYQPASSSPFCCDPTCESCKALRDEYNRLAQANGVKIGTGL